MSQSNPESNQNAGETPSQGRNPNQAIRSFITQRNTAEFHDDRVAVTIPGGAVTITESAEALFSVIGPRQQLFYRGGVVVEIRSEGEGVEVSILDPVSAQSRFDGVSTLPPQ